MPREGSGAGARSVALRTWLGGLGVSPPFGAARGWESPRLPFGKEIEKLKGEEREVGGKKKKKGELLLRKPALK